MPKNGFTLIELLVGIVIAMLCMVTMLMLFKQLTQVGVSSSQDAEYDAQLQSGILAAQKYIQNAGYGSGQQADIAIGTYASNPAIFWLSVKQLGAVPLEYQCQGIGEEVSTEGSQKVHRLVLLKKVACGKTEAVTAGTWVKDQPIVVIRNNTAAPIYSFSLSTTSACTSFGIDKTASQGLKQVQLTATRQYMTSLGQNIQNTICLNNITST
jgi:prepilin-type N-terminal cleavage/methylation domain-containing protein